VEPSQKSLQVCITFLRIHVYYIYVGSADGFNVLFEIVGNLKKSLLALVKLDERWRSIFVDSFSQKLVSESRLYKLLLTDGHFTGAVNLSSCLDSHLFIVYGAIIIIIMLLFCYPCGGAQLCGLSPVNAHTVALKPVHGKITKHYSRCCAVAFYYVHKCDLSRMCP